MQQTSGGLTEEAILKMPWNRFLSYCDSITEQHEEKKDIDYFNGSSKLANAWNKNKDKWQPRVVN